MEFKYFRDPVNFAYLTDTPVSCSICGITQICFDARSYSGVNEIDNICEECLKSGKLIELDIEANIVFDDSLEAITIAYKTPAFPNWQDTIWPVINGEYPVFERIASKEDFSNKQDFIDSFLEVDQTRSEIPWLWEWLPDKKLKNYKEAPDTSIYLFSLNDKKYWIWDAN